MRSQGVPGAAGAQCTGRPRVLAMIACGGRGRASCCTRLGGWKEGRAGLAMFMDLGVSTVQTAAARPAAAGVRSVQWLNAASGVASVLGGGCRLAAGMLRLPSRRTLPTATAGGGCWSQGKRRPERESCGRERGSTRQGADMRAVAVCQHLALTCCCAAAPASCVHRWQVPRRLVTHDSPMARADQWHHHLHCARRRCHGLPDVHLERQ